MRIILIAGMLICFFLSSCQLLTPRTSTAFSESQQMEELQQQTKQLKRQADALEKLVNQSENQFENQPGKNQSKAVLPTVGQTTVAYSVDYNMDKARAEKTVEHYGDDMQPIVQQAMKNNEDNPDHKSTAENSYQRESPLNDVLPEKMGESFSEDDLVDMTNDSSQ